MTSFPWLTVLWAVPMVGAAVVILLPARSAALAKWLALAISIVVLAITVCSRSRFDPGGEQYQFVESHKWIPSFGTGYILGLDGIALALVVLTAVLVPLLIVAGWNDVSDEAAWGGRSTHTYFALTLAVEGMVMMSLVSLDVLLFYVFFEAMLIPMYFLIGGFGGESAVEGGGEVPAVQPLRRPDHARRGDRAVRRRPPAATPSTRARSTSARSSPRCRAASSSSTRP